MGLTACAEKVLLHNGLYFMEYWSIGESKIPSLAGLEFYVFPSLHYSIIPMPLEDIELFGNISKMLK